MFQQSGGFSRYSAYMRGKKQRTRIKKVLLVTASLLAILSLVSVLGVSTLRISGASMSPNFSNGDRVLSMGLPYGLQIGFSDKRYFASTLPKRGDVVLARPGYNPVPSRWFVALDRILGILSFQQLNLESVLGDYRGDSLLVRRVVGVPGDILYMEEGKVFLKPAGKDEFLQEEQLAAQAYDISPPPEIPGWGPRYTGPAAFPLTVLGEDEYFLLCDNRIVMDDSRLWGTIPLGAVLGRIEYTYWPLSFFD
ncbi:signal peptidase I [Marispirochaeta sp.]|jgi:signal peptidase I|uniref:signal peptidase I n=1 Tax=Marispirochaeta sp. TaxID=2038653 RepID=UPI0029C65611|nr:signal peptidase I [Marispirochaeta sp.]